MPSRDGTQQSGAGSQAQPQPEEQRGKPAGAARRGQQRSEETRRRMSEAARRRWQRPGEAEAHSKRMSGRPKSPEHRAKISAGRLKMLESLGGWPEEWAEAMSRAHTGRQRSLAERYSISAGLQGKQRSPEVRQNMAAGQQRRRERERAERQPERSGGGGAGAGAGAPPQLNAALARERAVIEMSRLRQEVFDWMQAFEDTHGRKPTLPETAEASPAVYQSFVRYMALRDALRSAPAAPPPRSPAAQGTPPGQARAAPSRGVP